MEVCYQWQRPLVELRGQPYASGFSKIVL